MFHGTVKRSQEALRQGISNGSNFHNNFGIKDCLRFVCNHLERTTVSSCFEERKISEPG